MKAFKTSLLKPYSGWELKLDWCNLEIDTFKAVKVSIADCVDESDVRSASLLKYAFLGHDLASMMVMG